MDGHYARQKADPAHAGHAPYAEATERYRARILDAIAAQCPEMIEQAESLALDNLTPSPDPRSRIKYLCSGLDFVLPLLLNHTPGEKSKTERKFLLITEEHEYTPIDRAMDLFGDHGLSASMLEGSDDQRKAKMAALADKRCLDTVIYRRIDRDRVSTVCQPLLDKATYAITDDEDPPWSSAELAAYSCVINKMPALTKRGLQKQPSCWRNVEFYPRPEWKEGFDMTVAVPAYFHAEDASHTTERLLYVPVSRQLFVWKNPSAPEPCKKDDKEE